MFYHAGVERIGVRELNQQTSQVLERVRAGETIEITDRGMPVAEIRPVSGPRATVARLVASGRLAPATVDQAVISSLPMEPVDHVNVAELLASDREDERW
jgi:prevent-host-death family protein